MSFQRNLFLTGFMGAGKSSIGKKIARRIGFGFIDTDVFIEEKFNIRINDLILAGKIQEFRLMEHEALLEVIQAKNSVVATGGGLPCYYDNMRRMNENGITFYLKYSPTELYNRLNKVMRERPLLAGLDNTERYSFIVKTLLEREKFYSQAHYSLFGKSLKFANIIQLLNTLKLWNGPV